MLIAPAYAQTAAGAPAASGTAALIQLGLPFVLVFIAFYVLVQRPQARRQKAFAATIAAVKKNDSVVTAGGIVGKVTRVEDAHVEVEIAPNVRVRVVKATLTGVTSPNAKPAND
ncbi:preprotein translocase subunit YajC [Sphingomonas bacterium]|uniref:preprotein translocase subunit YajC n=1 Tax=Sphingomonas bacterium TaxID=1895847 RepID=UPI001575DB01|nr:preprotein translocase subunit YajC [Sphingomonas bacterium]